MFRKLQDRINAAATSAVSAIAAGLSDTTTSNDDENVQTLVSMGFTTTQATQALQATNGNLNQATELLLVQQQHQYESNGTTGTNPSSTTTPAINVNDNDEDAMLTRALQESYEMEQQRQHQQQQGGGTTNNMNRTAAMRKAAEAAELRYQSSNTKATTKKLPNGNNSKNNNNTKKSPPTSNGTTPTTTGTVATVPLVPGSYEPSISLKTTLLAKTHPDVKIIPKLQDKSKEEQVLRNVDRMKSYPNAVDTLHRALSEVLKDPNNIKFRTIDKTNAGYQRSVANVPGAEALLKTVNYHAQHNNTMILVLETHMIDIALLYLAVSALEQIKIHPDYIEAKHVQKFIVDVTKMIHSVDASVDVAIECSKYMSQCPTEPKENRSGAYIQIQFYTGQTTTTTQLSDELPSVTTTAAVAVPKKSSGLTITPPSSGGVPQGHILPTLRRRFDGDDTIQDVLYFIASYGRSALLNKLLDGQYVLWNRNKHPAQPIDVTQLSIRNSTLQYMECWPSGRFEIRPKIKK